MGRDGTKPPANPRNAVALLPSAVTAPLQQLQLRHGAFTNPDNWVRALKEVADLHLSLRHFGGARARGRRWLAVEACECERPIPASLRRRRQPRGPQPPSRGCLPRHAGADVIDPP